MVLTNIMHHTKARRRSAAGKRSGRIKKWWRCILLLAMQIAIAKSVAGDAEVANPEVDEEVGKLMFDQSIVEPTNPAAERMMAWMKTEGIKVHSVAVANFTNPIFSNFKLRGVEASSSLRPGDRVLSVPTAAILSSDYARTMGPLREVFESNADVFASDELVVSVQVMWELQRDDSRWRDMVALWPSRFATACEFNAAELRQLEGSDMFDETKRRQAAFESEYNAIMPILSATKAFPSAALRFAVFKYARLVVQTRAFAMHLDGGRGVLGIVPFADMFNHKAEAKVGWHYDMPSRRYVMTVGEGYTIGTQVYNSYGPRSNRRLLLDFGFVLVPNPFDFVEFPEPQIETSDIARNAVLRAFNVPYRAKYPIRLGEVPPELLFAVRVAHATPDELVRLRALAEQHLHGRSSVQNITVSVSNEVASLKWLRAVAETKLAGYRETLEEDNALLTTNDQALTRNYYNAIALRQSEKRILRTVVEFVNVHMPILEMLEVYSHYGPAQSAWLAMSVSDYATNVLVPLSTAPPPNITALADPDAPGAALTDVDSTLAPEAAPGVVADAPRDLVAVTPA